MVNSIYLAFNAINIGFSATNKTRIRNTYFLLDEKPYFNSGKIFNLYSITFPSLQYTFDFPKFINKVDVLSYSFHFIDTYADDWLSVYVNNHRYLLGGGWSVCDNYDNIYCSPVQNLTLNISVSHLNFDTSNTIRFYLENVNNGQMWLLLNKFKFYFIYRTK